MISTWFGNPDVGWETTVIGSNSPCDGSFTWQIPSDQTPYDYYRISVYVSQYSISDKSDGYFSIVEAQSSSPPPSQHTNQPTSPTSSSDPMSMIVPIIVIVVIAIIVGLVAFVRSAFYVNWVRERHGDHAGHYAYEQWKKRQ
jgi:hypothetical protein